MIFCFVKIFFRKERDSSAVHVYDFHVFKTSFSQMCERRILRLNLTSILCSEFYGHD